MDAWVTANAHALMAQRLHDATTHSRTQCMKQIDFRRAHPHHHRGPLHRPVHLWAIRKHVFGHVRGNVCVSLPRLFYLPWPPPLRLSLIFCLYHFALSSID